MISPGGEKSMRAIYAIKELLWLEQILLWYQSDIKYFCLQVDKASTFTVSYNGAKGTLNACVRTPSGSHEDCFIQEMDDGLYGLRFIPKENGVHYLDIKLNDHHIPDSPFAVMVGSMAADPAMVLAHGDGLESGSCGTCFAHC